MSSLVYRINTLLSGILAGTRIGTNLDLFLLLWTFLSGHLLQSRGGVVPALALFGLPEESVRRCWAALAYGRFEGEDLLERFRAVVETEGLWQPRCHGGFRPVAGDLTGFFRPCLRDCPTQHYSAPHGKALTAIPVGMLAKVGSVNPSGSKRLALPLAWVHADPNDSSERALRRRLLREAKQRLSADEVLVLDRGFPLAQVQEAGIERYLVRGPSNFTARRAQSAYKGKGRRPQKGEIVRPLPRTYRGRTLPSTPPDREEVWTGRQGDVTYTLRAEFWEALVLREAEAHPEAHPEADPFRCVVIRDPRFATPLLLVPPLDLSGDDLRRLYLDRWPIEGLPLVAKQMLGAHRQFVFGRESRHRLPELSLLAGAVLSYLAATEPAVPSGFWDRAPKPTDGRLRRALAGVHFEELGALPKGLRKKDSPTAHLPKGIQAHRRQKRSEQEPSSVPLTA